MWAIGEMKTARDVKYKVGVIYLRHSNHSKAKEVQIIIYNYNENGE